MNENILASFSSTWPQVLEAGMLLCFATSWPIAIMKMLRTKRAEGKSLGFVLLIFVGYLLGIAAKAAYASIYRTSLPAIIWLYVLNSATVGIDALLYLYYTRYSGASRLAAGRSLSIASRPTVGARRNAYARSMKADAYAGSAIRVKSMPVATASCERGSSSL